MWMIGAPQQICENDESRVSRRSDQDRTTTILNQSDPPKNERAHDLRAELSFGNQKRPEPLRRDEECINVRDGNRVNEVWFAAECGRLSEKVPLTNLLKKPRLPKSVPYDQMYGSTSQDPHAVALLSGAKHDVAGFPVFRRPEASRLGYPRCGQTGIHLIPTPLNLRALTCLDGFVIFRRDTDAG
jgi:hypothetical protein